MQLIPEPVYRAAQEAELVDAVLQFDDLDKQCKDAKIQAFPAWIINGQTYSGAQTFDKLEKILNGQ